MKKNVIKITESDLTRIVKRALKEDSNNVESTEDDLLKMLVENVIKEEEEGTDMDNPKDVEKFLELADNYLFKKFGSFAEKINTTKEKAMLIASLAKKWGVDANELGKVKSILNTESKLKRRPINEVNIEKTVKKIKARGKAENYEIERVLDYVNSKVGGTVQGTTIEGDDFTISTSNTGFNVIKNNGKKTMFAYDQIGNMVKYLKESKLDEAGGYDDPTIMGRHAGTVMGILKTVVKGILMGTLGLEQLINQGSKGDIMSNVQHLYGAIDEGINLMEKSIKDFTEDGLINDTKSLIGKLSRFNRKLRILETMGHDYSETDFMSELLEMSKDLDTHLVSYVKSLNKVDKTFVSRLSGRDQGHYGDSNDYFNN